MSYEKIIGDALFGNKTVEQAGLEVGHLYAVQRAIFCQCGAVLDVRTSVYFETPSGTPYIVCGRCFDETQKHPLFPHGKLKIHDGRVKRSGTGARKAKQDGDKSRQEKLF